MGQSLTSSSPASTNHNMVHLHWKKEKKDYFLEKCIPVASMSKCCCSWGFG
ncbi:unnamed protein product, partial [Vitis vinifera]